MRKITKIKYALTSFFLAALPLVSQAGVVVDSGDLIGEDYTFKILGDGNYSSMNGAQYSKSRVDTRLASGVYFSNPFDWNPRSSSIILEWDFSSTGMEVASFSVSDSMSFFVGAVDAEITSYWSTAPDSGWAEIRTLTSSGVESSGDPEITYETTNIATLPEGVTKLYYKVEMTADTAFGSSGWNTQWGRTTAGNTAFQLDAVMIPELNTSALITGGACFLLVLSSRRRRFSNKSNA